MEKKGDVTARGTAGARKGRGALGTAAAAAAASSAERARKRIAGRGAPSSCRGERGSRLEPCFPFPAELAEEERRCGVKIPKEVSNCELSTPAGTVFPG
jgi:hypothetical protein